MDSEAVSLQAALSILFSLYPVTFKEGFYFVPEDKEPQKSKGTDMTV